MTPLDMTVEELEAIIAGAYEEQLLREGRLTAQQLGEHDYSYAIPEITDGPERPGPEERTERFRRFVIDQLEHKLTRSKALLHTKLCVEAKYCRNKSAEGLGVIVGALDGILMAIIGYPVPVITVAAWLIKTKWLDRLCECEAT